MSKYKNKWTVYNGRKFQSKKEAEFAQSLDVRKSAAKIEERVESVEYQPRFPLLVNGAKCGNYFADFKVHYADGREEIIDVKGYKKGSAYEMFKLKAKLVLAIYGVEVVEV